MQAKHFAGVSLALVVLAGGLMAQTTSPVANYLTSVTTGPVGLAASQTAQLNVLNVTNLPPGAGTAIACPVELDFYDSHGSVVKTSSVTNVAPGTSASLMLKLSEFPTASAVSLHTLVRGVVRTNLQTESTVPPGAGPVTTPIYYPVGCSVFATLEVFDSTSGVTQSITSDMRSLQSFILPLLNRVN